jgi:hypothetical protein
MIARQIHDFGRVDEKGDVFEFVIEPPDAGACVLVAVVQTERGPRRTEVARVPSSTWSDVTSAAVRELSSEMGEDEREKRPPSLRVGLNRLSPLVGRELGVLLIALMEEGAADRVDALLHAWRELAREERWWLYAKAAAPGQQRGTGWRRALFHALSETSETRTAPAAEAQKKSSGNTRRQRSPRRRPRATAPRPVQTAPVQRTARARPSQAQPKDATARARAKAKARKSSQPRTIRK